MAINFNPQNLEQDISTTLANSKDNISRAEKGQNWNEVFTPLDEMQNILGKITVVNSHLNSVCFSDEFNAKYEKTLPLLSDFYSELGTNEELYQAFNGLKNKQLDTKQNYILNNVLKNFELSGIGLNSKQKQQYKKLSQQLSLLSNDFSKNSLKATNVYKKVINKEQLKGLDDNELAKLKSGDEFVLSLQIPQYLAVMTYCDDKSIRQELYQAFVGRASEFDDFDNTQIMQEILEKRLELAKLLGFENYSEYSLATKMMNSTTEVIDFLEQLIDKSKPYAQQELQELNEFAGFELKPWDITYYGEKLKIKNYGLSKSVVAAYFPFKQVLRGLLNLIKDLYNIDYEVINETTYHQDIIVLKFSENNIEVGKIYLDPFARKDKRSGAWMNDYQCLNSELNQKPIAFVVCNGSKPDESIPSLLDFDDVVTLFHEFGHALHHILTEVKYPSVAGIEGVPWDGVELPSQYMEFFAYEKQTIAKISKHYKTGEKLPDEMFEKLISSKNFGSGMAMLRQCEFSLWDILTHTQDKDTYEILQEVRQKTALIPATKENRFLNTFGHIFGGGYAAGYYSYKWAEVLAADAYNIISENRAKTVDFRKHILATGGESDFMQNYIKFSGRKPKIDALLLANGIK